MEFGSGYALGTKHSFVGEYGLFFEEMSTPKFTLLAKVLSLQSDNNITNAIPFD